MPELTDFHSLNSSSFEELITDLFNTKEGTNTYSILGRPGQKQLGIDIFSEQKSTAIQCKYKDSLSSDKVVREALKRELRQDVEQAASSDITFDHFILASTYRHDSELQYYAISLRDEFEYEFHISYIGWDEIRKWLIKHPEVHSKYFKQFSLPYYPIEFVSVTVDSSICAWEPKEGYTNAFFGNESQKSQFPVFDFSLINHLERTVLLKSIHLWAKHLYSGLHGIPIPALLEPEHTYRMRFGYEKENILLANPPLQIPEGQAFRFKLEVVNEYQGEALPIEDRNIFYFKFEFSSNVTVTVPKILINTTNDSNSIPIEVLE